MVTGNWTYSFFLFSGCWRRDQLDFSVFERHLRGGYLPDRHCPKSKMQHSLCLDAGNSRVKIALFSGKDLIDQLAMPTITAINDPGEMTRLINSMLGDFQVDVAGVCSVVPTVVKTMKDALSDSGIERIVEFEMDESIPFEVRYLNPGSLGRDRIAAVLGAYDRFVSRGKKPKSFVVVDAGSALTVEVVDKKGDYLGGIITAGPELVKRSLSINTAQLPDIDIDELPPLIGRDTHGCILSGVTHGFVRQVEGLLKQIEKELGYKLKIFLTGGWSELLATELDLEKRRFPNLVLEGIRRSCEFRVRTWE